MNWQELRYRGDIEDVQELLETYQVGDYLAAAAESRTHREETVRNNLLTRGIQLTERLSPRIYQIFSKVCQRLKLDLTAEIFCLPDETINAMAIMDISKSGARSLVGITSAALEKMEDDEIAFIIGHEFGHFLFENNKFNALLNQDNDNPAMTVLPPLGESLFLRWRKKAELSADRVGLIACTNFEAAGRSLLKAAFGLSDRNINLDVEGILSQIDDLKGEPEMMQATFASHPLLPVRLKALHLFSISEKASRFGYPGDPSSLSDDDLASQIDELMNLTRRHPTKPLHVSVMKAVALGGVLVLSSDRNISESEMKVLIQTLHQYFTDSPEDEIVTDWKQVRSGLSDAIEVINSEGEPSDKAFLLSRLSEIALADGKFEEEEGAIILEIAQAMGMGPKTAYGIMMGAVNTIGFRVDSKLNRIAGELSKNLGTGFGFMPTEQ
jgi:uncharacterized tellurite resistance protein B-like protein